MLKKLDFPRSNSCLWSLGSSLLEGLPICVRRPDQRLHQALARIMISLIVTSGAKPCGRLAFLAGFTMASVENVVA